MPPLALSKFLGLVHENNVRRYRNNAYFKFSVCLKHISFRFPKNITKSQIFANWRYQPEEPSKIEVGGECFAPLEAIWIPSHWGPSVRRPHWKQACCGSWVCPGAPHTGAPVWASPNYKGWAFQWAPHIGAPV